MSKWSSMPLLGIYLEKKIWNDTCTPMFNAGLFTVDKTWKQPKGLSTGEGNGNLSQYSCPENSMDRGAWWAMVHGITKSWTRLSTQHKGLSTDKWIQKMWIQSLGQEDLLDLTTHCSILAWKIPWTEEPGGLWSMGSQRVGHDWVTEHGHTHALI